MKGLFLFYYGEFRIFNMIEKKVVQIKTESVKVHLPLRIRNVSHPINGNNDCDRNFIEFISLLRYHEFEWNCLLVSFSYLYLKTLLK